MDYLDPKKKQAHKTRLLIGYGLFAILISMMTALFLFVANGYFIDRNTGEIIQNGLVFIDARPAQADVFLNGIQQRGGTDARLVIPEGQYKIDLSRDGYRPWSQSIDLEGGSLRRLTYARLIPTKLTSEVGLILPADPAHVSQSIDKRWLLISYPDNAATLTVIDLAQTTPTATELTLTTEVVNVVENGTYKVSEWADDNATVLLEYAAPEQAIQYVALNIQTPENAQNLSQLFAVPNAEITMLDRKRDRYFVYNPVTQILTTATIGAGVSAAPFIEIPILDYKTFATDWAVYMVPNESEDFVNVRLRRGSQDILLKTIKKDSKYMLELAKLGNVPVIAIASPTENPVSVFYDPEKYLAENPSASVAVASTIIRVQGLIDVSISSDSSTVMAYGTERFAAYEYEDERAYSYTLDVPVDGAQDARWMDGQHFTFSSNGIQHVVDFDGSNLYDLVASVPTLGSFFTDDIERMLTFSSSVAATADTPATPARLLVTSLVAPADL